MDLTANLAISTALPDIGNAEFLASAAGGRNVPMWVCAFPGDPGDRAVARWAGRGYKSGAPLAISSAHNTYFSTCELKPGSSRSKEAFVRLLVLVADDADASALAEPPSYVIETSPGSFQIGYLLVDDAESRDRNACDRALHLMVRKGLASADKSGNNVARYVRLPVGRNTKYEGDPEQRLRNWRPERRFTLSEALKAFGVTAGDSTTHVLPRADVQPQPVEAWVDDGPVKLDVEQARASILSGESLHDPLIRLAAHYAAQGFAKQDIVALLSELMHRSAAKGSGRWDTRMSKLEHDTVASAVAKFGGRYSEKVDFTDLGNANLLARLTAGKLRWVTESRAWLVWTAGRWEVDSSGEHAFAATGLVGEHYAHEVAKLTHQLRGMDTASARRHQKTIDTVTGWEKACRGRRGIDNMLALATKHPAFVISVADLDTHPELLGVQNGVVDLRTGHLRPDAREDFVTRRSPFAYRPAAAAERWVRFIDEVTGSPVAALIDDETGDPIADSVGRFTRRPGFVDYLQKSLGYTATGLTVEHKLFTVFGEHGSNGKNVVFDTVLRVLGGYAKTAPAGLLLTGRGQDANSATPTTAALDGVRMALCSEPPRGATFDNSVIKALTGESQMAVRDLHASSRQMRVTFHLWLLCNSKPQVEHLEQAVVGRILMLPFDRQWNRPGVADRDPALPDGDKHLTQALAAESEGILAWLVAGAVRYFAEGLDPCAEVITATRDYFQRQDPVSKWLGEQTLCAPAIGTQAAALFAAFETWRIAHESAGSLSGGEAPATMRAFAFALARHKVAKAKHGVIRYGVKLADDSADFEAAPAPEAAAEAKTESDALLSKFCVYA